MKLISTKELAQSWGISNRRVAVLASQGRIEGAKFVGGSWLFPADAKKPSDPRKGSTKIDPDERYIFPFILPCIHSEEQIENFSFEEKELYRICMSYEAGDFAETRKIAESLLASKNPYIRIGALFHLPTTCMYLYDFAATENYYLLFNTEILSLTEHKDELLLLYKELQSELESVTSFAVNYDISNQSAYSDDLIPLLVIMTLFSEMVHNEPEGISVSIQLYELASRTIDKRGYFFCAMYSHLCLSVYYGTIGSHENERAHMKQAIDIALEHEILFTLSYSIVVSLDTALPILSEYPPEVSEKITRLGKIFLDARDAYSKYRGNSSLPTKLTKADYELLSCCIKNQNIETMCETFGLSRSGMNRRLSNLYSKFGVSSKNELRISYINALTEWGKS